MKGMYQGIIYFVISIGLKGARLKVILFTSISKARYSGFGGQEVACWPLVPKFAGSNLAEAVGFFRAKKSSARLPSEGK